MYRMKNWEPLVSLPAFSSKQLEGDRLGKCNKWKSWEPLVSLRAQVERRTSQMLSYNQHGLGGMHAHQQSFPITIIPSGETAHKKEPPAAPPLTYHTQQQPKHSLSLLLHTLLSGPYAMFLKKQSCSPLLAMDSTPRPLCVSRLSSSSCQGTGGVETQGLAREQHVCAWPSNLKFKRDFSPNTTHQMSLQTKAAPPGVTNTRTLNFSPNTLSPPRPVPVGSPPCRCEVGQAISPGDCCRDEGGQSAHQPR